ncbi:DUF2621 family protein [Oceanobacillus bengalensis]|uniref:DUF2621 family protein n=1 Tax=Oceanobacillus bengalensis TaxID=1435466 RepID=A0A494Z409_9BACI|nr:DUF2621 family protein [Oceanobacillus bengalensis]RKQ17274.1 DUF2621 family protein [Oceanobacillus bengalensis]
MEIVLVLWGFFLIGFLAIGGFFMFRKFLKQIPKADGKSVMDWEVYYFEKTKGLWKENEKKLLEELISPVPELFRDVARQKIASKIGEIALKKNNSLITQDIVIEGYIIATPKRDHKFLRKKLKEKEIDVTPFEELFALSKDNYQENWETKYKKQKNAPNH